MIWTNGKLTHSKLEIYPDHPSGGCIYEVIRIANNCPVFLDQHLDRMYATLESKSLQVLTGRSTIIRGIADLIQTHKPTEGNLRIQINRNTGGITIGFIPHHYPSEKEYREGVSTDFLKIERPDPNLKIWNPSVRKAADDLIHQTDAYEIILVNSRDQLTEGSHSNIFVIQNNQVITPPIRQVLPGITRQIILQHAVKNNIPISEEDIQISHLEQIESAFISGTSPGVLPLKSLGEHPLIVDHPMITKINTLYLNAVEQNIKDTVTKYTEFFSHD